MHAAAAVSIALAAVAGLLGASTAYADDYVRLLSTWAACLYRHTDAMAASEVRGGRHCNRSLRQLPG